MKRRCLLAFALIFGGSFSNVQSATPINLDELLLQIRQNKLQEVKQNSEREFRFLTEKDAQKRRLEAVKASLAAEQQRSDELQHMFDKNADKIAVLETKLQAQSGVLSELFGVVRQVAGDAEAVFEDSLVSTQIQGRKALVGQLANSDRLPNIERLEDLWFALQQEMTESGKVISYPARVVGAEGIEREQRVTRIGVFTAVVGGKYLRHLREGAKLQELTRQPARRYQQMANSLENATHGIQPILIDASRGSVLALLMQAPDLMERIRQGGLVGYVIIAVGIIGLLIALQRTFKLSYVGRQVRKQLSNEHPDQNNPLGRVMAVYRNNTGLSPETLELKMDESILKDSSNLQRGLLSIKVLAAIAPLLGLLGTVTGLIETFQSITLFGAGDPGLMAGGISQALVTTVLGLSAAIPLILLHSVLTSKSRRLLNLLEEQSAGIIALQAENGERRAALA